MKKFAASLTAGQLQFARKVERLGIATYSQAVKAIERNEIVTVRTWQVEIAKRESFAGGI